MSTNRQDQVGQLEQPRSLLLGHSPAASVIGF
jgi:hypothetical protein